MHNSLISRDIKDKLPLGGLSAVGAEWHDIIVDYHATELPRCSRYKVIYKAQALKRPFDL